MVARDVGRFNADDLAPLLGYLENPLDTTDLVLVAGGGRLAKKLTQAQLAQQIVENDYINGECIRMDGGIRMQPK